MNLNKVMLGGRLTVEIGVELVSLLAGRQNASYGLLGPSAGLVASTLAPHYSAPFPPHWRLSVCMPWNE